MSQLGYYIRHNFPLCDIKDYVLIHPQSVHHRDNHGWTPLTDAVSESNIPIINFLIKTGADLDTKTNSGHTPLMLAVKSGDLDSTKILIEAGADVNIQNAYGKTALIYSINICKYDIFKELIKAGANTRICNIGYIYNILGNRSRIFILLNKLCICVLNSKRFLNHDLVRKLWEFL